MAQRPYIFVFEGLECRRLLDGAGEDLAGTEFGRAWVYPPEGPIHFDTGQPNPLVEVRLDNLGVYDDNGNRVGPSDGHLRGKYVQTEIFSANDASSGYPKIDPIYRANNDFRVDPNGGPGLTAREAVLWNSEVSAYYYINDYRNRFLNDAFIDELHLPDQLARNLKYLQYRPDLDYTDRYGEPALIQKFRARIEEAFQPGAINLYPDGNMESIASRQRGSVGPTLPPLSQAWDAGGVVSDYAGLAAWWMLGSNTGFPSESFYGEYTGSWSNIGPALNDGLSSWVAYRYTGIAEWLKYGAWVMRDWAGRDAGPLGPPKDRGQFVDNVMMSVEGDTSRDGVFPPHPPSGLMIGSPSIDGAGGSDWAGDFIGAVFYDIANVAGLGLHKADLLIWKSISLISEDISNRVPPEYITPNLSMRQYGAKIQEAARQLFPDTRPGREGKSIYEEDVGDVLTGRGIPVNGVADFRDNLPPPVGSFAGGTLERDDPFGFGSRNPERQPGVDHYGEANWFWNGYTHPDGAADYVAYQFYKHSKYGPGDKLILTDGTFTDVDLSSSTGWRYNNDGTFYAELTGRELGNLVVLAPGRTIRWMRIRGRMANEAAGSYQTDVRPLGFRVTDATSDGFSFHAADLGSVEGMRRYGVGVVDPSMRDGDAYAWTVTDFSGATSSFAGPDATFGVAPDEPFTITLSRTRDGQSQTLTLRERGDDFARDGGNAYVLDLTRPASVAGGHVFYNRSALDGRDGRAGAGDDGAIAADKTPFVLGDGTPGIANVTSYTRGINGVMVDVIGLRDTSGALLASHLGLKIGSGSDPDGWAAAPAPSSVSVRRGAGVGGSDRVTLVWPDGAIVNTWLRVTVPAAPETGLAAPAVFYFGNLVGETGDAGGAMRVSNVDLFAVRRRLLRSMAGSSADSFDFNRDGRVNALDAAAVRVGLGHGLGTIGESPAGGAVLVRRLPATPPAFIPLEPLPLRDERSSAALLEQET